MDYAIFGMNADVPKTVSALGGNFAYPDLSQETPDTMGALYEFDKFNLIWDHAMGIDNGLFGKDHGIAFIGNNGTLVVDRGGWEVIPENKKMEAVTLQKKEDDGLLLHTANFLDVIQSRKLEDLKASIQAGGHVATVCQMGNIAYRTGKKIYWDAGQKKFTDNDANKFLAAEYHNGYSLPKV